MSKMFQIYEDDLAELERTVPRLADALYPAMNNRLRTELRRVQAIITNVRWNYGPPEEVKTVPVEDA